MALQPLNIGDYRSLPRSVAINPVPIDVGQNASFVLTYTGTLLTQVDKVLDTVTFRRTLTYTGTQLTGVSAWVQV